MKAEDLRGKTATELEDELVGLRREQFSMRMQLATGELPRHTEFKRVRKDIARVKTVMNEQKRAAGSATSDSE